MPSASLNILSRKVLFSLVLFLAISAVYLYGFPQTNVEYAIVVLLHAVVGVAATVWVIASLRQLLREGSWLFAGGWILFLSGAGFGLWLIHTGTLRSEWGLMYGHIVVSAIALGFLVAEALGRRGILGSAAVSSIARIGICLLIVAGLGFALRYTRESRWANHARIENPTMPPPTMDQEGDGTRGMFFPSSAQVYGNKKIPSAFFMQSDSCKRC